MAGEWILAVSLGCLGNDASIKIYHPRAVKKDGNCLLIHMMYKLPNVNHQSLSVTNFITFFCTICLP